MIMYHYLTFHIMWINWLHNQNAIISSDNFYHFLKTSIIDDVFVKNSLWKWWKVRIPLDIKMSEYLWDNLRRSNWNFDDKTGTYVSPGADLSLWIMKDDPTFTSVLRIEVFQPALSIQPLSSGKTKLLIESDPISALFKIALMSKWGMEIKEDIYDSTFSDTIMKYFEKVSQLLASHDEALLNNHRDDSLDEWGLKVKSWYNGSIEQVKRYNWDTGGLFKEVIENGFLDGGRSARFFNSEKEAFSFIQEKDSDSWYQVTRLDDGRVGIALREFIRVDRNNDPILWKYIESIRTLRSISNESERARAMLRFVFEKADKYGWEKAMELSDKLFGIKNLWKVFQEWAAVCRHRSLMIQVLWQELWLEVAIRKWVAMLGDNIFGHSWNEIKINGKWQVIDITLVPPWARPDNFWNYQSMSHLGNMQWEDFVPFYKKNTPIKTFYKCNG